MHVGVIYFLDFQIVTRASRTMTLDRSNAPTSGLLHHQARTGKLCATSIEHPRNNPAMPALLAVRQFMSALPESIDEDLSLADAKDRMFALDVHHLPVLHQGQLVGIISHRDVAVAETMTTLDAADVTVAQIMTPVPFTCGPNAHVEAVAREMAAHRYGSAVVVDPDHPAKVVGIFTTTDALRALADIVDNLKS